MSAINTHATIKRILFRDNLSGFAIVAVTASPESFNSEESGLSAFGFSREFVCKGVIPECSPGMPVFIEGEPSENTRGKQVQITDIRLETWDEACLANFIQAACNGIGKIGSQNIAKAVPNLVDIASMSNGAEVLVTKVPSLSLATATELCASINRFVLQREVYRRLAPYGATWASVLKLVAKHGRKTLELLEEKPYEIGDSCHFSFAVSDQIAKAGARSATAPDRVQAAIKAAFKAEQAQGNVCSAIDTICAKAKQIVQKNGCYAEAIPSACFMQQVYDDDLFVVENTRYGEEFVFSKPMWYSERAVADHAKRLMRSAQALPYQEDSVEWAEKECGIQYAPQQKACFDLIRKSGIAIITGGPGTGKSTTLNGLIAAYERNNPNGKIALCAPTGRAAQRIKETTKRKAWTVHRLLGMRPFGNDMVYRTAANPIEADLVVVDEASMLDTELTALLFGAVKTGALLVLLGDVNQLPSVGAGNILRDLIDCERIPTVQLRTVYRQGKQSPIVQNATRINDGYTDFAITQNEFSYAEAQTSLDLQMLVCGIASDQYDPQAPFDFQILCPAHKGDVGVAKLNALLQEMLNPPSKTPEYRYGSRTYRVRDKVIMLNNNYDAGYFNGDIGVVTLVTPVGIRVRIGEKELDLTRSEMEDVNLAYAMSIHKSQGSEFKKVLIALPKSPANMLRRNLLYTAVTRAKQEVFLCAERDAVNVAATTSTIEDQMTMLQERMKGL